MENPTHEAAARYVLRPSLNHLSEADLETLRTWNSSERVLPELTEEEEDAVVEVAIRVAIDNARLEKGQQLYNQAYAKKVSQQPQFPALDKVKFREIILAVGKARSTDKLWPDAFKIDEQNKGIINTLCMYFTVDPDFLKVDPSFSFNKGILLIGPIGCGKTELMRICNENPKLSYSQHDCQDIVEQYSTKDIGPAVFEEYGKSPMNTSREKYFAQPQLGRFFDDLGAEPLGKHMGNERNVMGEIIQIRHKKYPHYFTHFTSNLAMDELESFYGARVADRLREMCNVIEYPSTAKSRRR
jgi:DNA replication protein DnaC